MSCGPGNHYKANPVCESCGVNVTEEQKEGRRIHASRHEWTLIAFNGHRYFLSAQGTGIAVADESGALPQDTADGILWLDITKPIREDEARQWFVPLRRNGGDPDLDPFIETPVSWQEVITVVMISPKMRVVDREGNEIPLHKTIWDLRPKDPEYD